MSGIMKTHSKQGNKRKEFRNIHVTQIVKYRMPAAAIVSILHRVSGALMFLLLPFVLYLFEQSMTSEISFDYFKGIMSVTWVKLIVLALVWACLHHFLSGLRHLMLDIHVGLEKTSACRSAKWVLMGSLSLAMLVAFKLFGAF